MKHWYIQSKKADFNLIAQKFSISPVLSRIIRNRDIISDEQIDEYLNGDVSYLHDASLLDDSDKACAMIKSAIKENIKICIMGDYDIDGVCAGYILKTVLSSLSADVYVAIPDRVADGYGMNADMVCDAYKNGTGLIITCDNGIKAHEAVLKAKELGIKTIITDHHEAPDKLPDADVIIDPHIKGAHYPFDGLCGAAVAYKLMQVLDKENPHLDELMLFAGFATIGDIVPLKGENRIFAKEGIKRLRECKNAGLNALMDIKQINKDSVDAYHIGFILGPCINSAGRLKDASIALDLLECEDEVRAYRLAEDLSRLNDERKELTDKNSKFAEVTVRDRLLKQKEPDKILCVYLPDAHESIAGIIASRLKEAFHRPSFVVTNSEKGLKGSGRSIETYNMIKEVSKYEHLFKQLGGHAMACGFTLKDGCFDEFARMINEGCELSEDDLEDKKWIDMQLPFEFVSEELIEELALIKPYGAANAKPVFADNDIRLLSYSILGKNKNVLRMTLENKTGKKLNGIMFGSEQKIVERQSEIEALKKEKGDDLKIAILYYPEINEFRDMRSIQLLISDFDISR